jgi:cytochrome c553
MEPLDMKPSIVVMMLVLAGPLAQAADMAAGKARAEAVCAACHGANGVSVADAIPNLAGQKAAYLEAQLKALKDGSRKNAVMAAIASQLSADDIANVAAHFAGLPVAGGAQKSDFLPQLARSAVPFPEDYKASYVRYHTINFPATKQVRHYYANPVALKAAREGRALPDGSLLLAEVHAAKLDADNKPITGADGFYEPDKLLFYTAMGRDKGWGAAVPDMLRNEDWSYAAFTTARQPRTGVNQAECLACHKPLDKQSFTFTIKELATAAMR